jgi:cytochrome c-type biogenesis protein CcmH/NrfG
MSIDPTRDPKLNEAPVQIAQPITEDPGKHVKAELLAAHASIQAKRFSDAERRLRQLLKVNPKLAAAMGLLATVLAEREDFDECIRLTETACALVPNVAAWHGNLCTFYRVTSQFDQAIIAGGKAIQIDPKNPSYYGNVAIVMADFGRRDASNAFLIKSLRVQEEDFLDAHRALAENLLSSGDWVAGWHENSLGVSGWPVGLPKMQAVHWNGMTIPQGRILIHADAGYGDVILFARFMPEVVSKCAEVIVACSPEMEPVMRSLPGIKHLVTDWTKVPPHAAYCKGMELPEVLGSSPLTALKPPYLFAPADRMQTWKERVEGACDPNLIRVGLSWHGKPLYPLDPFRRRSIPIETMAKMLGDIPGAAFFNLQTPMPKDNAGKFPGLIGEDWKFKDWGDTAAVVHHMDVVLAIDSAVVNLSGAMAQRTIAVVPRTPAWRWWGCGEDPTNLTTPWYPSAHICRQPAAGDWEGALIQARDLIEQMIEDSVVIR